MTKPKQMPLSLRTKYEITGTIPSEWADLGYHLCPDWDFMLIGPGDREMEACACGLELDS